MKLDYTVVLFDNLDLQTRDASKLRGYFANKYREDDIMSNHAGEGVIYRYPKVQYKVVNNMPLICGIQEGASTIANIGFDTDTIDIAGVKLETANKQIIKAQLEFGVCENYILYEFLTPWMGLNQKNAHTYQNSNNIEKEEMLKKILTGNILSMSKGLNYTVDKKLYTWINLRECNVNFKNVEMIGFKGQFKINFKIPDFLGIGKSVSRGFGTIGSVK